MAAWLVSLPLVACASSARPAFHTAPPSSPAAAASPPPKVENASRALLAAPPAASSDPCHIDDELKLAHGAFAAKEPMGPWLTAARPHLLPHDDTERALSGIAQEIVSALAYRHYDKLRNFADEDGICLRAARGAACETLTLQELTACGHFGKRRAWAVDEGKDSPPEYTCGEAFRKIFYARDFLRVPEVRFNCFPEAGRSKSAAPIVLSGPAIGYVEFHDPGPADGTWPSLWLVFDGEPTAPVLVEMISDY
ncbi:MAG TPA: hypothetical protein VF395_17730 [Polyangiaceae bacterium]